MRLGNGNGSFGAATNLTAGTRPIGLAIADLNGDGKPDIVTANLINSVSVLLNTTTVPITTLPTSTTVTADNATYDGLAHGVTTVVSPGSAAGTTTFLYTGTGGTVYNSNVAPSNAGTYHVVASFTPANPLDFDSSTGSADYTIDKATISYTFGNAGHVYGSTVNLAAGLEVGRFSMIQMFVRYSAGIAAMRICLSFLMPPIVFNRDSTYFSSFASHS